MGLVSTRRPDTRTNISGEAPTSCSAPMLMRKLYGLGLLRQIVRNSSAGVPG